MTIFARKIQNIALIGAGFCLLTPLPAQAGFEFMPAGSAQPDAPQAAAPMPIVPEDQNGLSAMPVLPSIPVTAQPLPPMDMAPPPQPIANTNEVYVPRVASQGNSSGGLVINPYPLQASGVSATHGSNNVYVEQAMMQEAGALKGIAAPGANYTSQITNNAQNIALKQAPKNYEQVAVTAPNNYGLTPMAGETIYPAAISAAPLAPPPVKPQPAPVAATPMPSQGGYAEAVGFGRDLPLALALSQVVPPDYNFSFGQNVNVGSTVSWQGGKSWDAVLQEMLAPVGMKAVISGKNVVIQNAA